MTKGKRNGRDSVIKQRGKQWGKNDRRALSGPSVGSAPASAGARRQVAGCSIVRL